MDKVLSLILKELYKTKVSQPLKLIMPPMLMLMNTISLRISLPFLAILPMELRYLLV